MKNKREDEKKEEQNKGVKEVEERGFYSYGGGKRC